jgi:hypothetical protein
LGQTRIIHLRKEEPMNNTINLDEVPGAAFAISHILTNPRGALDLHAFLTAVVLSTEKIQRAREDYRSGDSLMRAYEQVGHSYYEFDNINREDGSTGLDLVRSWISVIKLKSHTEQFNKETGISRFTISLKALRKYATTNIAPTLVDLAEFGYTLELV